MNLPKPKLTKVTVAVATAATLSIIGGVTAVTNNTPASSVKDTTPTDTTSQASTDASNLSTQAQASPDNTNAATTSSAKPAPGKPKPQRTTPSSETISKTEGDQITVVKYQEIVVDELHSDCLYTYSDGTTYQFPWKTVNPTGGTQTMPDGSTKTVPTTGYNGVCDYSAIGLPKS